ncbi:hypothetical protein AX14_007189 [Amanita brunnescens Koide BX004]|nr:hypothetical protein AX14_007189 [Amanita brunnescens Koide BX004]
MLRISSLTPLLISILALFAAAQLDRRHQDKESFVTVPLTQDSNLTPTRRSTLATNMGKDAVNLERRWTEFLVNNIPPILRKISYIDHLLPVTVKSGQKLALIDQGIYTGKITIGSPPQTFSVGFATSLTISEIGIPGPNHKTNEPVQNALYKKNKYIARDSPTHMENTHHIKQKVDNGKGKNKAIEKTIEKTDGLGTAIEYRDTMTIANIEVTGQYFVGVVTPPFIDAISAEDGQVHYRINHPT